MLLAAGLLAAPHEGGGRGPRQGLDAAMTGGAALLCAFLYGLTAQGRRGDRRRGKPIVGGAAGRVPRRNYVGDFGGGGMLLAVGLLAALHEAGRSGRGQVIDAAMTDGTALLSAFMYGFKAKGQWSNQRGENLLDGGAHFYDTYACADGKYIAIGAIEPQFYAELRQRCGIQDPLFDAQLDAARWPLLKLRLADVFRTRTRQQWCELLEGSDACFAPVLDWDEAPQHAHTRARATFTEAGGVLQPAPAPRFSRSVPEQPRPPRAASLQDTLAAWNARS